MYIALGKGPYGEDKRIAANPILLRTGTFALVSQTAYWVYLGWCAELITPAFVNGSQTVASATVTTAEFGFFSTPLPSNRAGQTVTKIVAGAFTGTGTGLKRNSSAFVTALTVPVHLWAGVRVNATTAGTFSALARDWSSGNQLQLAAAGTFAATSTFAGVVPAFADATTTGPDLFGSLD